MSAQTAASDHAHETLGQVSDIFFDTLCVIEFSEQAHLALIAAMKEMLTRPRHSGGAGLLCFERVNVRKMTTFHLGCTFTTLLDIAEYVNIKKRCVDGTLQVLCLERIDSFLNSNDPDKFFTRAEKYRLVLNTLESVKSPSGDFVLPGHPNVKVNEGSSIVLQCLHRGLIVQVYPLHDSSISTLSEKWYKGKAMFSGHHLDDIKDYFGETIGMYFGFLDFYTKNLILPAAVGLLYVFLDLNSRSIYSLIVFSIINIIWTTMFLEGWKQKSSSLAYTWGTHDIKIIEEPRPSFFGEMAPNAVTGKLEPEYPKLRRMLRFYCISFPIILLCLSVCFVVMWLYLWSESITMRWYNSIDSPRYVHDAASFIPMVAYSLAMIIMNQVYRTFATKMNEWENHRLQSAYDNHLIIKLVLFWFINTFTLMFYTAFYQQDLAALRKTLLTELIVTQVVDQLQEIVVPYFMYKLRKQSTKSQGDIYQPVVDHGMLLTASASSEIEANKQPYEDTFDDFLELFIQFGYVTLFSSIFPLAAALALINNLLELRTDALKLCRIYQRPFAKPTAGIGVWQGVFSLMGFLAIITNCALVGLCAREARLLPEVSDIHLLLLVVGLEHILIVVRAFVSYVIPAKPKWVEIALARDEYHMKRNLTSILPIQTTLDRKKLD